MQDQIRDPELAGLARSRPATTRPAASADQTILAPIPAPLDCPYLLFDDDGPGCLALAPAIRLSRRQVELVCAGGAHVACPRLIRADSGRAPAPTERPPAIARRRDRRGAADDDRGPVDGRPPTMPVPGRAAATAEPGPDVLALAPSEVDGAPDDAAIQVAAGQVGAAEGASLVVDGPIGAAVPEPAPEPVPEPVPAPESGPRADDQARIGAATVPEPTVPEPTVTEPTVADADAPRPRREVVIASPEPRRSTRSAGPEAPGRRAAAADRTGAAPGLAAALTTARRLARTHIVLRPATAAAWLVLLGTLVVVIALLASRGGLTLPPAASASPGVGAVSPSSVVASPTGSTSPSTTSPSPSGATASAPAATPSPSPVPTASPPFPPDRLAVLTACPGVPGCYQYRIKPNDNLRTLAKFFGVAYPALLAANPQIANPSIIHVGDRITIPVPSPHP